MNINIVGEKCGGGGVHGFTDDIHVSLLKGALEYECVHMYTSSSRVICSAAMKKAF